MSALYKTTIDRESAYEVIKQKVDVKPEEKKIKEAKPARNTRQSPTEVLIKSTARAVGSQVGRQLIRGLLGSLFGGKGK